MFKSVAQTTIVFTAGILVVTVVVVIALGGSAAEAAVWALFLALASRVVPILGSFVIAYWPRHDHPVASLGPAALLRTVSGELWATLILFFVYHPFEKLITRHESVTLVPGQTPIVLVHGFYSNAGFWHRMKQGLRAAGWENLFSLNLEPLFTDLDHYAEQLRERIEQVCAASGSGSVIVVTHSMGGLVARACARRAPERIRHVICLGTPHHGTALACLVPSKTTRQMRPNSDWLRELNADCVEGRELTNLYSEHDNIIVPQTNASLRGAENVPLQGIGHLEMAFSNRVLQSVTDILSRI